MSPGLMRLSHSQSQMISEQIHRHFGEGAAIWLFGSRLDDHKKGGDVDLYVEAAHHTLLDEIRCKIKLEESLDMPVDLIVRHPTESSLIAKIAKTQGERL
jgi:predicted nucleotidyltransferase